MISQYWRIFLQKERTAVTLFLFTTDDMVGTDLDGPADDSLIRTARQYHRHPPCPEQDHRDLAIGAVMAYATEPVYDRTGARLERGLAVPDSKPAQGSRLVSIWEVEGEHDMPPNDGAEK